MALGRHAGARVKEPNCLKLEIRAGLLRASDRKDAALPNPTIPLAERPEARYTAQIAPATAIALTSGLWSLWFAQPLPSQARYMRKIITKLLIAVVPRHTAGDG